jgi:hypothetical protein
LRRSKTHEEMKTWLGQLPSGPGRLLFFPCLWSVARTLTEGSPDGYVVWYDADWRVLSGGEMWKGFLDLSVDDAFIWDTRAPSTDADRVGYAYLLDASDFTGRLARIMQTLSDGQWVQFAPNGASWL